jgi:hypothetical protein
LDAAPTVTLGSRGNTQSSTSSVLSPFATPSTSELLRATDVTSQNNGAAAEENIPNDPASGPANQSGDTSGESSTSTTTSDTETTGDTEATGVSGDNVTVETTETTETNETTGSKADSLNVKLNANLGDIAANRDGDIAASGLLPGSDIIVEVHSTPVEVGRFVVDGNGNASGSFQLPQNLEDGEHRIVTHGLLPNGKAVGRDYGFAISGRRIARVAAVAGVQYPIRSPGVVDQLAVYSPAGDAKTILQTQGQLFAVLAAAGAAAVATQGARGRTRSTKTAAAGAPKEGGGYTELFAAEAVFEALDGDDPMLRRGDRSRTWRWKGAERVDRWSRDIPDPVNRFSPLAARAVSDGMWLRAAFGPLALVLPAVGIVLGMAAAFNAGGTYLPPAVGFVAAILILGIADAGAGAIAGLGYVATTALLGGLPTATNVRSTAGLVTLWFAPVLGAAMIRPIRRALDGSRESKVERLGDCVIGPMFGAWTAQSAVWALSGLAGRELPIGGYVGRLTLIAGATLLVRYLLETLVLHWYPKRSLMTHCGEPDETPRLQQIGSVAVRSLTFIFVANAFYPLSWQLLFGAGTLAFSILAYLEWFADRAPNISFLHRFVPGELTMMAVLLVACDFIARALPRWEPDPDRSMLMGIVYFGIPTIVLGLLALVGREGKRPEWKQWHYVLGIPLTAALAKVMFFA